MISTFSDNLILVLYTLLWLWLVVVYRKKTKQVTLTLVLILIYAVMAPVCIYLYNTSYTYLYFERNLTFMGFLYLFLMIVIALIPIFKTKEEKINGFWIPNSKLVTFCCVVVSLLSIYSIIIYLPKLQEGLVIMLSGSDDIVDLYEEAKSDRMDAKSFSGTMNYLSILSNVSDYFIPLLLFLYLLLKRRSKIVLALLFIGLLKVPVQGIANASRFQLISQLFVVALLFFFFKPYMKPSIVNMTKKVFVIVAASLLVVFVTISMVRSETDNKTSTGYGLARYYAQGPLVFDNFCLDANGTREGHFTFPVLLHLMGEKSMSENELRAKYSHMKVDNSRFTTFVGDFVLDYGPVMAFVLFLFFSLITSSFLSNKGVLSFGQIIILYLSMRFCCGFYQYQLGSTAGNLYVFLSLIIALLYSGRARNQIYIERNIL